MQTQAVYPGREATADDATTSIAVQAKTASRLLFADNIRIYLTILVVLHHLMVIYAGSGGWIYQENLQDDVTSALGNWFTSVNHSYFMGLFLLISAYFVPGSYERKGAGQFMKDRLIRLGIPLAIYSWILRPVLIYARDSRYAGLNVAFTSWYRNQYFRDYGLIGGGPLWFIEALLVFSALYAIWRMLSSPRPHASGKEAAFPGNASIALFALLLGVASFIVRIWIPSDTVYKPLNFQFADFPQYIALFTVGLKAYHNNWLVRLPHAAGRFWLITALVLILSFPPIAIFSGAIDDDAPFTGGWHWQSMLAAQWQAFLCVSMCISVIYTFRRIFDRQGSLAKYLSRNAYTVYLIHEPVITALALALIGFTVYPLLKFVLVALLAVPVCYLLSSLIRKLPYTERVL